jgi:hypothetical protein
VLSPPDPIHEFMDLSKRLWPLLSSNTMNITLNNKPLTVSRDNILIKHENCVQIVEPLQPLPMACGRLRYEEFTIESIDTTAENASLILGFALNGIQGQKLTKTKFSVGIDLFNATVFDGFSIAQPLSIPFTICIGDRIGIGMCFECHSDEQQLDCFFATRNGSLIYESRSVIATHRGFYLSSLFSLNTSVALSVNRGHLPFAFDITSFQKKHGAAHDFFRSYLSVSNHLYNTDGQIPFWTPQRISENFAFCDDYSFIGKAIEKLPESGFITKIARFQIQLYRWQKLHMIFIQHMIEHSSKPSLHPNFATQAVLNETLSLERFDTFHVDFNKDLVDVQRQILRVLTNLRYQTQLNILIEVAERYKMRGKSIFEDENEIRGGGFEGWIKMALFMSTHHGASDWIQLIRDSALEQLLEADFNLSAACPGYLDDNTNFEEPHHKEISLEDVEASKQDADGHSEKNNEKSSQTEPEVDETGTDEEEERKAIRIIAIASTMRAWAAWMGAFIDNLESELLLSEETRKMEPIPKDVTLTVLSKGIMHLANKKKDQQSEELIPSPSWLLVQYLSLGFGYDSNINTIPSTFEDAVGRLICYFDAQAERLSPTDISMLQADLNRLMDSRHDHEELAYLQHQFQLATGEWVPPVELAKMIYSQTAPGLLSLSSPLPSSFSASSSQSTTTYASSIQQHELPNPTESTTHHQPTTDSTTHLGPFMNNSNVTKWIVLGGVAVAVLSGLMGAAIAVSISSLKSRSNRN